MTGKGPGCQPQHPGPWEGQQVEPSKPKVRISVTPFVFTIVSTVKCPTPATSQTSSEFCCFLRQVVGSLTYPRSSHTGVPSIPGILRTSHCAPAHRRWGPARPAAWSTVVFYCLILFHFHFLNTQRCSPGSVPFVCCRMLKSLVKMGRAKWWRFSRT